MGTGKEENVSKRTRMWLTDVVNDAWSGGRRNLTWLAIAESWTPRPKRRVPSYGSCLSILIRSERSQGRKKSTGLLGTWPDALRSITTASGTGSQTFIFRPRRHRQDESERMAYGRTGERRDKTANSITPLVLLSSAPSRPICALRSRELKEAEKRLLMQVGPNDGRY
ncbi:uncharacterized protein UTRI_01439 [Ustilago trichophora]|uniref:Uncharacterized protein n=1 Tax=Ustilago trichophora TaxID=86804 RepID=A0A5C3DZQ1_9BASI|nr:uncharacterized protein UTRI_01439 [Ustilago trichophora]